jgi:predicted DCC family thiol-disulfide oxidoreductase YuxK
VWQPGTAGAAGHRRFVRVVAGMFSQFEQLGALYRETAAAVLDGAAATPPDRPVATRGRCSRPVPLPWDDARYARVATGRAELTGGERAQLGEAAERFSLLG